MQEICFSQSLLLLINVCVYLRWGISAEVLVIMGNFEELHKSVLVNYYMSTNDFVNLHTCTSTMVL